MRYVRGTGESHSQPKYNLQTVMFNFKEDAITYTQNDIAEAILVPRCDRALYGKIEALSSIWIGT